MDGTSASPLLESGPPTVSLHYGLVRETARDTDTTAAGSPIAKNVPVLRVNHATAQDVLPGMRQVSQPGLRWQSAHALWARWSSVNRCFNYRRARMWHEDFGGALRASMRKQYLPFSAYSCDRCSGPVVAGSLAVRENEISKETDIRQVGAVCPVVWSSAIQNDRARLASTVSTG